jgi:hypothetical protein
MNMDELVEQIILNTSKNRTDDLLKDCKRNCKLLNHQLSILSHQEKDRRVSIDFRKTKFLSTLKHKRKDWWKYDDEVRDQVKKDFINIRLKQKEKVKLPPISGTSRASVQSNLVTSNETKHVKFVPQTTPIFLPQAINVSRSMSISRIQLKNDPYFNTLRRFIKHNPHFIEKHQPIYRICKEIEPEIEDVLLTQDDKSSKLGRGVSLKSGSSKNTNDTRFENLVNTLVKL